MICFNCFLAETCVITKTCKTFSCFSELEKIKMNSTCTELKIYRQTSNFSTIYITENFTEIKALRILNCEMKAIEAKRFATMKDLKILQIAQSKVEVIEGGAFEGLLNLTMLQIGFNQLTKLGRIFDEITKLADFHAKSNQISEIDEEAFKNNKMLLRINLCNNSIESFKPKTFNGLFELKDLNLSRNLLSSIELSLFDDNEKLMKIDLSFNRIITIEWSSVAQLTKLSSLIINDTSINVKLSHQNVQLIRELLDKRDDDSNAAGVDENLSEQTTPEAIRKVNDYLKNLEYLFVVVVVLVYLLLDLSCGLIFVLRRERGRLKDTEDDVESCEYSDEFEWRNSID
jgi:Leucine-rich repeat (LRR) protein